MAKILITGIMGTLGRPLQRELEGRGHNVWGLDLQHQAEQKYYRADVANFRQLERAFEQEYDYVYHLAAEFGRINGEEYYDTLWETNVIGTRNILEFGEGQLHQVQRLLDRTQGYEEMRTFEGPEGFINCIAARRRS